MKRSKWVRAADNVRLRGFRETLPPRPRYGFMPHNIPGFFDSYANLYNRALAGEDVFEEIMARFSPKFIAAGPDGVSTGKQDGAFRRTLEKGYRFYRDIGTKKMTAKRVEVTPIDGCHAMAKVVYRADYEKEDGSPLQLEFDVTYFLDTSTLKPKIFGFVAGDEMGLYRQHGLIPEEDSEAPKAKPRARPGVPDGAGDRAHH